MLATPLTFRDFLSLEERSRRSGHLRRGALQDANVAPFWQIYNSGHDDAMITLTGFDYASFNNLHSFYKPRFDGYTPFLDRNSFIVRFRYRPTQLAYFSQFACTCIMLVKNTGLQMVPKIIFGITRSALSVWIKNDNQGPQEPSPFDGLPPN